MDSTEQLRFDQLYQKLQQCLVLQGMRPKTIEAYSRAVRRIAAHVDRCPDTLTADEAKGYFAALVRSHSWSTVKLDRCGLQFFYRHVLDKSWQSTVTSTNAVATLEHLFGSFSLRWEDEQ